MTDITIGADPELFVKKGDQFLSGFGLIPGDKMFPHPVPGGAVQVDGMALEFNIDPAKSEEEFLVGVTGVMEHLRSMIPPDLELTPSATAIFDTDYMRTQPAFALELGCDPDFNAYTGVENPSPEPHPNMRTAAGHIHVGWSPNSAEDNPIQHFEECRMLTKQMDFLLGLPSILLDPDHKRREMYGKAGAFRPKPYGVEYRVLSNFWLKDRELMRWVYHATIYAFDSLVSGAITLEDHIDEEELQFLINNPGYLDAWGVIEDEFPRHLYHMVNDLVAKVKHEE